ncbi:MAG: DUF502 domain-containing protein [Planctomycetota bacterium]
MADPSETPADPDDASGRNASGKIFARGLAITLPSILTVVIVIWLGGLIYHSLVDPITWAVRSTIAQATARTRPAEGLVSVVDPETLRPLVAPRFAEPPFDVTLRATVACRDEIAKRFAIGLGRDAVTAEVEDDPAGLFVVYGNEAVPYADYRDVALRVPAAEMPTSPFALYAERVNVKFFTNSLVLSLLATLVALLAIYFVGRVVTVRLGAYFVNKAETIILEKLPFVGRIYSSLKQVTDFVFSERTVQYNRVVAIEYPREGIWSLGFVTGTGMRAIAGAAGEATVTVLVPTSPMPMTGYTMSVPRSRVLDLDITIDQAFQFTLSCGVLVPRGQEMAVGGPVASAGSPSQLERGVRERLATREVADVTPQPVVADGDDS